MMWIGFLSRRRKILLLDSRFLDSRKKEEERRKKEKGKRKKMMQLGFTDISNSANLADYVPILAAALMVDMLVSTISCTMLNTKQLARWYKTFNLGAVLSDVLILVIGVLITRYIYPMIFKEWCVWKFLLLALAVQITHDFIFYGVFSAIPRGTSGIMDLFKDYAAEYGGWAIFADSVLITGTVLVASLLAGLSMDVNAFILVVMVYLVPYFVYSFKPDCSCRC